MIKQRLKVSIWAGLLPIALTVLMSVMSDSDAVFATGLMTLADVSALDDYSYKVTLSPTELESRVGRPVFIRISLSPYPPPAGLFYSSVVDVLESPNGIKPEILSDDREIQVTCSMPGNYRLLVRVNLISKSSCGGAAAHTLKEKKVFLSIGP